MKKIKYSRLFILGIFIYIIFKGVTILIGLNTSVLVLKNDFYTMKINKKCIVIRDEYLIKSNNSGTLSLLVDNYEKIKKSQNIAIIYNNIDDSINNQIKKLKEEIKNLEIENNSLKRVILSSKKEELNILQEQIKSNTTNHYVEMSGIISYKYDNNESKYNTNNLSNITKEDIENESNNYITTEQDNKKIKQDSIIARIVDDNECYVEFVMEDNKLFNKGDSVKIEINDNKINGEVCQIYTKNNYYVIVLKITQRNIEIYDTRVAEFDIIYRQIEALRIPKESIIKKGDKIGVYVINEENNKPEFVEVKGTYFDDEDYVYIDFRSNELNGINTVKLYDRIILKPNFINKKTEKIN